jgi:hypothetical protein
VVIGGLGLAVLVLSAWVGSRETTGTFGITDRPTSCGSVWGLPGTDDLNAASCVDELRGRVTLVGALFATGAFLTLMSALGIDGRYRHGSRARRAATLAAATLLPLASAATIIVSGHHLIWSVSGA